MTSMELEAYKAELACEILTTDSRQVLDEVKRLLTKLSKKTKKKQETIRKDEILAGIHLTNKPKDCKNIMHLCRRL